MNESISKFQRLSKVMTLLHGICLLPVLGLAFLQLQMHSDLMNTCTNVLTQYQFFSGFFLKGIASEALMCTLAFLTFLYITFL